VALSTLRQLGLIFISLFLGGFFICLLHLVIHAFAKANLFLIVGNLIHSRFSLQDSRLIRTGTQEITFSFIFFIRVLSLRGVFFSSGFYSKDFIIIREFRMINRMITFLIIIIIISMTFVYCIKFFYFIRKEAFITQFSSSRIRRLLPSFFLRTLSIVIGILFIKNIRIINISKLRGVY
jgi:NADH-quinone oxidoreductase subunit L